MNEIEFNCPQCGQQVACDETGVGVQIACPTCSQSITVPPVGQGARLIVAPPVPKPKLPPLPSAAKATATKPAQSAPATKPASQPSPPSKPSPAPAAKAKAPGLAVASLVLSLATLVLGPFGCIPGIICGHMAKTRLKRDGTLGGRGLANAGLVIGYSFLALSLIGTLLFFLVFAEVFQLAKSEAEKASTNEVKMAENQAGKAKATKASKSGKTGSSTSASSGKTEAAAEKAVSAFLNALKERDNQAIAKLLTEKARQNFKPGIIPLQDPQVTYEIGKTTMRTDSATVQVKAAKYNQEMPFRVRVRREAGEWRVYSVSLFAEEGKPGMTIDLEKGVPSTDIADLGRTGNCLLYTSPSPRDGLLSRMPSSA